MDFFWMLLLLQYCEISFARTANHTCAPTDFQCSVTRICLDKALRCNGHVDCGLNDNSDEKECSKVKCSTNQFQCENGNCIDKDFECDGEDDCTDGTDEHNCQRIRCPYSYQFRCGYNGRCIPRAWVCNGVKNCMDGSDEADETCRATPTTKPMPGAKATTKPTPRLQKDSQTTLHAIHSQKKSVTPPSSTTALLSGKLKCNTNQFQCKNGNCIDKDFECDGEDDCTDGTDERNCKQIKCPYSYQFRCGYNGRCIRRAWVCNGVKNCMDGSDEADEICRTTATTTTTSTTTKPLLRLQRDLQKNLSSIYSQKQLVTPAPDSTVPSNGTTKATKTNPTLRLQRDLQTNLSSVYSQKKLVTPAPNTTVAISSDARLDDISIPVNGKMTCNRDEFQCENGNCIDKDFACDGEDDCADGTDEHNCQKIKCPYSYQFRCGYNGRCIRKAWVCNGVKNCVDGSDEADETCSKTPSNLPPSKTTNAPSSTSLSISTKPVSSAFIPLRCTGTDFKCGETDACIHQSLVCDGKRDCPNNEDEPQECGRNECALGSHGCSQYCTDLKIGYKCICREEFYLLPDNKTCISPLPELLIAMRSNIRKIRIDGQHYKEVIHNRFVEAVISVDIDVQGKMLYLADLSNQAIARVSLENIDKVEHVVKNVENPKGIAFDWISKKIYWSSTHPKYQGVLEASNADGSNRIVLVNDNVDRPRAVIVHPLKRLLFWTDLGKQPRIERVSMDGLERKVVIDSSQLTWPNGLTIDYASDRIFWADSKRNLIGSSDLDGSDILIVARNIQNPSSLTVFEDSIYWTNDITGKAFQANKLTGSITHQYQITLYYPTDVKIIHPLRQKAGENPCGLNNGGCTHLCLLSSVKSQGYSCVCPTGFTLHRDGRQCKHDAQLPSTRKQMLAKKTKLIAIILAVLACTAFLVIGLVIYRHKKNQPHSTILLSTDEEDCTFETSMLAVDMNCDNKKEKTCSFESCNSLSSVEIAC